MLTPVHAAQIADPAVAEALKSHVAERSQLLDRLTAGFRDDLRIRAAWLWGSFSRGEEDDLSDLDPWLIVEDAYAAEMGKSLKRLCESVGMVVSAGENPRNGPSGGGYLGVLFAGTQGLHHVDLYWQPSSQVLAPTGPLLFDRSQEPVGYLGDPAEPTAEIAETPLEESGGRIAFVWLMLSVVAKHLARDSGSDMALLGYPKNAFEETVAQLGLQNEADWSVPEGALAKVDRLRHIAEKTAVLEAECRARGLRVSGLANPCLRRYFDLVAGIIGARTSVGGVSV